MPPMSGGIAGPPAFFSGLSATMASVVTSNPAFEAASCNAVRPDIAVFVTMAGAGRDDSPPLHRSNRAISGPVPAVSTSLEVLLSAEFY